MIKRTVIFLAALLLLMSIPAYIKYQQIQVGMAAMAGNTMPPVSVEAVEVRHEMWQTRVAAVGTLSARDGIEVKNEVEGVVEKIHVVSGQMVAEGDLLVTLNTEVEQADLVSLQAQEVLAKANYDRTKQMWDKNTISEREFDNAQSNLQVARANLAQVRARIAKKKIRAPFSGILGIRNISRGQYIAPGTRLFSLQDHQMLYTDFAVPERHFPVITTDLEVQFKVSAYPDRMFSGRVQAIESRVDESTRSISVRARLANDDGLLLPGMYADIYLVLNQPMERFVVPSTAITFSSFGDSVFVIEQDEQGRQVAQRVQVTTGEQRGDEVEILTGLAGDELVVQAGTGKLKNNTAVAINQQRRLKD
jgi:membrane fusion protein (multidrug efflux system)